MFYRRLETAIARVIAEGKVRSYNMSGRRGDTNSPHRGGQAVAMVAKIPPSTWPKRSPITPVHKPRELRSEIVMSEIEAREFSEFKNQPKGVAVSTNEQRG